MIPANQIIHLSPRAFWDVDMSKMDYQKKSTYIIRKVFEFGSLEDVLEVWSYYGDEKTKEALLTAPYLMEKTMRFASTLFNVPSSAFKCFTTKQYHPLS